MPTWIIVILSMTFGATFGFFLGACLAAGKHDNEK